jgi:plastocyanin
MRLLPALLLFASVPAVAEPLSGTIEDRALRRKTDLVYLEKVEGNFPPPAQKPVVNQRGNTYLPHVVPILVGSTVVFQSEDKELHNVFARGQKSVLFNDAVLPGARFERTFKQLGVVHLTCNIHKEMSAFVVVLQNPYFARIDPKSGEFLIQGIPPGKYTLRIWGEGLSEEQNARSFPVTVEKSGTPLKLAVK